MAGIIPTQSNRYDFPFSFQHGLSILSPYGYSSGTKPRFFNEIAKDLGGKSILVVEDNDINRRVISSLLEAVDIKVESAENGQQAVEKINSSFSALLMDIEMPVLDGLAATRMIRQLHQFKDIPIIAMTGYDHETDRQRCLAAGMNHFLVKPIHPEKLFATIIRCLHMATSAEEHCPNASIPPQRLILNHKFGVANLAGDHALYLEILNDFLRVHAQITEKIIQPWQRGEEQEAQRITHLLKGVAGTIKTEILEEEAYTLEQLLKKETSPREVIETQFNTLLATFLETRQAIRAFLEENSKQKP